MKTEFQIGRLHEFGYRLKDLIIDLQKVNSFHPDDSLVTIEETMCPDVSSLVIESGDYQMSISNEVV